MPKTARPSPLKAFFDFKKILTNLILCAIVCPMEENTFWNTGRRKYLARIFSNASLLFIGAIGTSEIFKLALWVKLLIAIAAIALIVSGTIIQPVNNKEGE
jgi:hypothetical protein